MTRQKARLPSRSKKQLFLRLNLPILPLTPILVRGLDELPEERMRFKWLGFEFRMELASKEVGMSGNFDDFYISSIRSRPGDAQARPGEQSFVFAIEFVAVAMALTDFCLAIGSGCDGVRL